MSKEQLLNRIACIREEAKPYARDLLKTKDQYWYDECVRYLSSAQQEIHAFELTLSLYDEIAAND